jgi:hypothetical protein
VIPDDAVTLTVGSRRSRGHQLHGAQNGDFPGDKLVDPKTQALNRVLFHATLDGDPIDGTVEFTNVPGGGPSYAARTTVTAPAKKLTAKIENSSYVRQ